jgi:hypothetical protein
MALVHSRALDSACFELAVRLFYIDLKKLTLPQNKHYYSFTIDRE